jgi:hypothetical protein
MKAKDKRTATKFESTQITINGRSSKEDLLRQERIKKLQKKADSGKVNLNIEEFVVDVIYGEKWKADHLDRFPEEERKMYFGFLEHALNLLAGEDRDRFIERIERVLNEPTRNNIWELEHVNIVNALDTLARENNRFAARLEIANKTGYSLKIIDKRLQESGTNPYHKKRQEELQLMRERLLSRCYKFATGGDMRAARLFFEVTASHRLMANVHNEHNNFIQVNNLTITEEQINALPQDKRQQMTEILGLLSRKTLAIP